MTHEDKIRSVQTAGAEMVAQIMVAHEGMGMEVERIDAIQLSLLAFRDWCEFVRFEREVDEAVQELMDIVGRCTTV